MKNYIRLFFIGWWCLLPIKTVANDWINMYGEPRLFQQQSRLERKGNELYAIIKSKYLNKKEQQILQQAKIAFPLIGFEGQWPLEFYAKGNVIYMPTLSLLFWEDLCIAYAWLWANGYSLETVDEYLTMLYYKKPEDFPGSRYPSPLTALQIPRDAITTSDGYNKATNHQVEDLSLRFRNSGWAFILLHELGHVLYKHPFYKDKTQARLNEEQADRFALEVMERSKTIPMGALLFFQAQAYMMPNKGKYIAKGYSEKDWETYFNNKVTHPLTTQRLETIALNLNKTADKSIGSPEKDTLRYISTRLIDIVDTLEDQDLQGCMADVAVHADPSSLAPRRSRESREGSLLEKWCGKR